MTLVTETGAGLANAEAYNTTATASAYLTLVGGATNAFTTASTADQEIALRAANAWLFDNLTADWKGSRLYPSVQALDWPRYDVTDLEGNLLPPNTIPVKLKQAEAELALRYLTDTTGHPTSRLDPDIVAQTGGPVVATSATVGPISESLTYASGGSPATTQWSRIRKMLRHLLTDAQRVRIA